MVVADNGGHADPRWFDPSGRPNSDDDVVRRTPRHFGSATFIGVDGRGVPHYQYNPPPFRDAAGLRMDRILLAASSRRTM